MPPLLTLLFAWPTGSILGIKLKSVSKDLLKMHKKYL